MKPFYLKDGDKHYTVLVYLSVHENDDYMVVIREEKYMNYYVRIVATDPEDAAKRALKMHCELEEAKKGHP